MISSKSKKRDKNLKQPLNDASQQNNDNLIEYSSSEMSTPSISKKNTQPPSEIIINQPNQDDQQQPLLDNNQEEQKDENQNNILAINNSHNNNNDAAAEHTKCGDLSTWIALKNANCLIFMHLLAGFLSLGGAVATGLVSTEQYLEAVKQFGVERNREAISFGIGIAPSLFNFFFLNYKSNKEVLGIEDNHKNYYCTELCQRLGSLFHRHLFLIFMVSIPASGAEFLIAAGCTRSLLSPRIGADMALIWGFIVGGFAFTQYLCLESKELIERVEERFTAPKYKDYHYGLWGISRFLAIFGALGTTGLAYVEGRSLIAHLMIDWCNADIALSYDWGTVIGASLAVIYGVVHFSLFGHKTLNNLSINQSKFKPDFKNSSCCTSALLFFIIPSAIWGALNEGVVVGMAFYALHGFLTKLGAEDSVTWLLAGLFGGVIFCQNYLVAGKEWFEFWEKLRKNYLHSKNNSNPLPSSDALQLPNHQSESKAPSEEYSPYSYKQFLVDGVQGMLSIFVRLAIEVWLLPVSTKPQDENTPVTITTYAIGIGLINLLIWMTLNELPRLWPNVTFLTFNEAPQHNAERLKIYELRQHFIRDRNRLTVQAISQWLLPVALGVIFELLLRDWFNDSSVHITPQAALDNAQVLASFLAVTCTLAAKRLIDAGFWHSYKSYYENTEDKNKNPDQQQNNQPNNNAQQNQLLQDNNHQNQDDGNIVIRNIDYNQNDDDYHHLDDDNNERKAPADQQDNNPQNNPAVLKIWVTAKAIDKTTAPEFDEDYSENNILKLLKTYNKSKSKTPEFAHCDNNPRTNANNKLDPSLQKWLTDLKKDGVYYLMLHRKNPNSWSLLMITKNTIGIYKMLKIEVFDWEQDKELKLLNTLTQLKNNQIIQDLRYHVVETSLKKHDSAICMFQIMQDYKNGLSPDEFLPTMYVPRLSTRAEHRKILKTKDNLAPQNNSTNNQDNITGCSWLSSCFKSGYDAVKNKVTNCNCSVPGYNTVRSFFCDSKQDASHPSSSATVNKSEPESKNNKGYCERVSDCITIFFCCGKKCRNNDGSRQELLDEKNKQQSDSNLAQSTPLKISDDQANARNYNSTQNNNAVLNPQSISPIKDNDDQKTDEEKNRNKVQ